MVIKRLIENGTKRIAILKSISRLLLIWVIIQTEIDAEPFPLKMTIESHLGAGYFAELTSVVSTIKGYEPLNLKELNVDWSQEFFPYKDNPNENGWDLYFEPIVFDMEEYEIHHPLPTPNHSHFMHDQLCIKQHATCSFTPQVMYLSLSHSILRILNRSIFRKTIGPGVAVTDYSFIKGPSCVSLTTDIALEIRIKLSAEMAARSGLEYGNPLPFWLR